MKQFLIEIAVVAFLGLIAVLGAIVIISLLCSFGVVGAC